MRYFHLVFSPTMAGVMVLIMTCVITLVNVGPAPDFLARWGHAILIAYPIAAPIVFFLAPVVRGWVTRYVEPA